MNLFFFIVTAFFFFFPVAYSIAGETWEAHTKQHKCEHDHQEFVEMSEEVIQGIFNRRQKRILDTSQPVTPLPIRLQYNFDQLSNSTNGSGMNSQILQVIQSLTHVTQLYLQNLIKVVPRTTPIKTVSSKTSCKSTTYPIQITPSGAGISNADLLFLVSYYNNSTSSTLVDSYICEFDPNPVVGRIRFNINNLQALPLTNKVFQDYFATVLHEITHILGFSSQAYQYWIDPSTNAYYGTTNLGKIITQITNWGITGVLQLTSPNVLRYAQNYYKCPYIQGMTLENQGGSLYAGSHWEMDLIKNEFMTSSLDQAKFSISQFTAALLRDTGYYADINSNFMEPIYWGYGEGCDFFNNVCNNTSTTYTEFPSSTVTTNTCDFYSLGYGTSTLSSTYSQCSSITAASNRLCYDDVNFLPEVAFRQNTGLTSRCFASTAILKGYSGTNANFLNAKCMKTQCSSDYSSIQVFTWDQEYVTCTTSGQVIDLSATTSNTLGTLTCPKNFYQFCNFPNFCKNSCSQNGVCLNGQCLCLSGYAGVDCSVSCASPNSLYDGSTCVPSCASSTFANPDNTCKSTCPKRYYPDTTTSTCIICHSYCSACTGPASTECSACNFGYQLSGTTCAAYTCDSSCGTCFGSAANQCTSCFNYYYLNSLNQCQQCSITNCLSCNSSTCLKCQTGYQLASSNTKCNIICDSSCVTCSTPLSATSCTSCLSNQILVSGQCLTCNFGCSTCSTTVSNCSACILGYVLTGSTCKSTCFQTCKTCTLSSIPTACTSCIDGYYLKNNQCLFCNSPCQNCIYSNNQVVCTSCLSGYTFNSSNNTCTPICHPNCVTCTLPQSNTNCLTCQSGFYFTNNSCLPCTSPCLTCTQSPTQCTSCISTTNYTYNPQRNRCSMICNSACSTCLAPNDITQCSQCVDGYYLDQTTCKPCTSPCTYCTLAANGQVCLPCPKNTYFDSTLNQCVKCSYPCLTCENSADFCLSCVTLVNYTFNKSLGQCIPTCDSTCQKCTRPLDHTKCISCVDGYFLSSTTCVQCQSPCSSCIYNASTCTSCIYGYSYNSFNNSCEKICDISCETCTNPKDKFSCTACASGYVLLNNLCKRCQYPCEECQTSQNNCTKCFPSFIINKNVCHPSCHYSCDECSTYLDQYKCTKCKSGQYLEFQDEGRCISCQSPCQSCTSSNKCLSCIDGYKLSGTECIPVCDKTCKSCVNPNDKYSCLQCQENHIRVEVNKTQVVCVQCPTGKYSSNSTCQACPSNCSICSDSSTCTLCNDGYSVSGGSCVLTKQCYSLCQSCVDYSYSTCTSCVQNRDLLVINSDYDYGICVCPSDTTDTNLPYCKSSSSQASLKNAITSAFSISIAFTSILSILMGNPTLILLLLEFTQNVSNLAYINSQQPIGVDDVMQILSYSQFSKFISTSQTNTESASQQQKGSNRRVLQQESRKQNEEQYEQDSTDYEDEYFSEIRNLQVTKGVTVKKQNPKFLLNNKSSYFIKNTIILYLIQGIGWGFGITVYILNRLFEKEIFVRLNKLFNLTVQIILLYLCCQEQMLLIFYQVSSFDMNTNNISRVSFIFAVLTFIYVYIFLMYLYQQLEHKCIVEKAEKILKEHVKTSDEGMPEENKYVFEVLERFYIVHMTIKQDNALTRNFLLIMIFSKTLTSCILATFHSSGLAQVCLVLVVYMLVIGYIACYMPFKTLFMNIVFGSNYCLIFGLHLIYTFSVQYETSPSTTEVLMKLELVLILLILIAYTILSIFLIVLDVYKKVKKYFSKNEEVKKETYKLPQTQEQQIQQMSLNADSPQQQQIQPARDDGIVSENNFLNNQKSVNNTERIFKQQTELVNLFSGRNLADSIQ